MDQDIKAFADALQGNAGSGGFNPLAMLTGSPQLRAVVLAPLSPNGEAARDDFLRDGSGPLASVVTAWQQQGVSDPEVKLSQMVSNAQGMLVLIGEDNQGPLAWPQYFFGTLSDQYIDDLLRGMQSIEGLDTAALKQALLSLRRFEGQAVAWPETLVVLDDLHTPAADAWQSLLLGLAESSGESLLGGMAAGRSGDLPWWVAEAVMRNAEAAGMTLDAETLAAVISAYLQAEAIPSALAATTTLLQDDELEDEALAELLEQLTAAALRAGEAEAYLAWLQSQQEPLDNLLGGMYELAMPILQTTIAANAPFEAWQAAAESLRQADRKALRQALTREPIWRLAVAVAEDDLLTPDQAADRIDRSLPFVSKRLEAGLLPVVEQDGELRLVASALAKWQQLLGELKLLE